MPTHLLLNTIPRLTRKLRKVFIYFQHLPGINIFNLDPSYYFSHHSSGEQRKVAHILVLKRSIRQFHLHCGPVLRPHIITSRRAMVPRQEGRSSPDRGADSHDLTEHRAPSAPRKPILLLSLHQALGEEEEEEGPAQCRGGHYWPRLVPHHKCICLSLLFLRSKNISQLH